MTKGPLELVSQVATILDDLGSRYALGGSMASSLIGEPRSTVDVDIAIKLEHDAGAALLDRARAEFYVPNRERSRRDPRTLFVQSHRHRSRLEVDLFVLGEGLLDRMQIERRIAVTIPGIANQIWVTSPEYQVLRKLDWYRSTGQESERRWRDVVGILRVHGEVMDRRYLVETARALDLGALLDGATNAANSD